MKREIIYNKHGLCVSTDGNHTNITMSFELSEKKRKEKEKVLAEAEIAMNAYCKQHQID
jgi:hypothetical protein